MPALAVAIDWEKNVPPDHMAARLLDCALHRGKGTQIESMVPASLGVRYASDRNNVLAGSTCPPLVCVADMRLDNRDELVGLLGGQGPRLPGDAGLLLQGYLRWGEQLAFHLEGDFAFAIWDEQERCLYAARDPFGVRPFFFYAATSSRFLAASEVEQLLAADDEVGRRLEDRVVLDYLTGEHRHPRETFFAGIHRLLPGHWLRVDRNGVRSDRYWIPPFRCPVPSSPQEAIQEFQARFRQAVARRLPGKAPVVAQLSGGLDSSSIACMAEDIYEREGNVRPPVYLASMVYPGLDCDETPFIAAVRRQVRFSHCSWDGTGAGPIDEEEACAGHPWAGSNPNSLEGDFRLAEQIGAEALLTGFGGDELIFEQGVFRELAQRGWWWTLGNQLLRGTHYSTRSRWHFLREALGQLLPGRFRRPLRRFRRGSEPPSWLSGRLQSLWRERATEEEPAPPGLEGATAEQTWRWLTRPQLWEAVELQSLRAARQGLELRFPFLDRSLAEYVLSLPVECRLPGGRMKRLLRQAMSDLLPDEIAERPRATIFNPVLSLLWEKNRPFLEALFAETPWLAEPFVDRRMLRSMVDRVEQRTDKEVRDDYILNLLDVAQLERWLRTVHKDQDCPFTGVPPHESATYSPC